MKMNRRQKAAASAGFVALAATAVLGGTLAQFTDQDTTDTQTLQAGTVAVDLVEGANWDTSGLLLAVDDTVSRSVTVNNTGNLALGSIELSADVADTAGEFGGNLSEAVTVTITQGADNVLADKVLVSDLAAGYDLDIADLAPGASDTLKFDYKVVATPAAGIVDDPTTTEVDESAANGTFVDGDYRVGAREDVVTNPDNAFQGAAMDVEYTVNAVQRAGIAQ